MPSSGRGNTHTVSDYEHLNSPHFLHSSRHVLPLDNSGDSDFLPLKPSKSISKNKAARTAPKPQQPENVHSTRMALGVQAIDKIGLTQMLDDFGQLQAVSRVPVPMAWSPGMKHAPNPALFITPEKSLQLSKTIVSGTVAGKENTPELLASTSVPVPVAWSPGMVLKPNPALQVTPDRGVKRNNPLSLALGGEGSNEEMMETLSTKNREKPTVRFDLPSASSGEETLDTSQEFFSTAASAQSPITLKGCDLKDGRHSTPAWKAFSPQKAYDPGAYSDESTLDASIESPSHPPRNSAECRKDIDGSTSDRLADKLQELLLSSTNETLIPTTSLLPSQPYLDPSMGTSQKMVDSDRGNISSNLLESNKIISAVDIPCHPKPAKAGKTLQAKKKSASATGAEIAPNAGPQFLKKPPSAYEPAPASLPQPHVFREHGSTPERNSYSFPFDVATSDSDLGSEHAFARPEYNSTLRVRSELDDLCGREIDVKTAVATTLTKSESKRTELNEKASVYTNRMSDQFGNLVEVEPSVNSLCSRVVRMRTNKIRSKKTAPAASKKAKPTQDAPDLMEFLPQDLQKEAPDFSLPGVKMQTFGLQAAPHDIAFDLYRHNRVWQGISDY